MRFLSHHLRLVTKASSLLLFIAAAHLVSAAQTGRRDSGVWNPNAHPKPARRTATPRPSPRPAPHPARVQGLTAQYRLLKVNDNGSQVEVSPVTVFNPGDRLRMAVKTDADVYVFVIHQRQPGAAGEMYFPDSRINGGQNIINGGAEFVIPSNCSPDPSPAACSHPIDEFGGREFFTLIFSRSQSVKLLDDANEAGGVVSPQALDAYVASLGQRLDASARGDTVFARAFRNLNPKTAGQVVVRLVLNKRGRGE
jgi:hypothetical protein